MIVIVLERGHEWAGPLRGLRMGGFRWRAWQMCGIYRDDSEWKPEGQRFWKICGTITVGRRTEARTVGAVGNTGGGVGRNLARRFFALCLMYMGNLTRFFPIFFWFRVTLGAAYGEKAWRARGA